MSKEKEPVVVTIRRTHAALVERSREINETYSSLLSALIFPFVLQKTLFSQNSPFYRVFLDYFARYAPDAVKEVFPGIDVLENLGKIRNQMGSTLDTLPPPNPLFSSLLKPGTSEEAIRKAFYSITADICRQQGCRTNADITKVSEQVNAEFMKEAELHVLRAFKGVKINMPNMRENMPRFLAELEFTNVMNVPKILGVWLGKRFFMDPLLQRYLTNGIEPLPRFLELQPPNELRALLTKLNSTEKAQRIPARRAAKISMSILPILLVLYLFQVAMGFRIPQILWLTCFSFLFSGTTHVAFEAKKRYDEYNYRHTLQNKTLIWENLFNNAFTQCVSSQDFRSLKSSRIFVTFKNYNDLTASQVCRTIVHVLNANGIKPADGLGGSL